MAFFFNYKVENKLKLGPHKISQLADKNTKSVTHISHRHTFLFLFSNHERLNIKPPKKLSTKRNYYYNVPQQFPKIIIKK